jgi:single-strand DNA-binding protein
MNQLVILGNLTADPEMRFTQQGVAILNFNIASSIHFPKGSPPLYMKTALFGKLAETLQAHLKKGKQVLCTGRLQPQTWTDRNGQKRDTLQLVASTVDMLGGAPSSSGQPPPPPNDSNDPPPPPDGEADFDGPPTFG